MSTKKNKIKFNYKKLEKFIQNIFISAGLNNKSAADVAYGLVRADLRGVWSHGAIRTNVYVNRILKKQINSKPKIKLIKKSNSAYLVDGNNGIGFTVAKTGIKKCIDLAKKNGVGLVGIKNSNHFGMASLYIEEAVRNNCIAWVFTNASKALPPHGAMEAHFGTSPFAFGAPTQNKDKPFVLDMASSAVARGKLKFAAIRGEKIPFGLALDKNGNPTNDGEKAWSGIMLPFGGMKGAGISWMMDIVGGILTGSNHSGMVKNFISDFSGPARVGHLMICVRSNLFQSHNSFVKKMDQGIRIVKKLKKAKGFKEILHPGEPEYRNVIKNKKSGVEISIDQLKELNDLAIKLNAKPLT